MHTGLHPAARAVYVPGDSGDVEGRGIELHGASLVQSRGLERCETGASKECRPRHNGASQAPARAGIHLRVSEVSFQGKLGCKLGSAELCEAYGRPRDRRSVGFASEQPSQYAQACGASSAIYSTVKFFTEFHSVPMIPIR